MNCKHCRGSIKSLEDSIWSKWVHADDLLKCQYGNTWATPMENGDGEDGR